MAKKSYKIRSDLDTSKLDIEISLFKDSQYIDQNIISLRVIGFVFGGVMFGVWWLQATFMKTLPILFKIIFAMVYLAMLFLLARYTKRKEMQLSLVEPFLNYLPKRNRYVSTRLVDKADAFYFILGISAIKHGSGLIKFSDGSVAYMYKVVGSASRMLFERDRDLIIDRTESFFTRMREDAEIVIMTTKESQKIYSQIAALKDRYERLEVRDPDLLALMEEQFDVFKQISTSYKSIHQYMLITASNMEALKECEYLVRSELRDSDRFIRRCEKIIRKDDIEDILSSIYNMNGVA